MRVFENEKYKIEVVDSVGEEAENRAYPQVYRVTNLATEVIETYETMLPQALAYVLKATDMLESVLDKKPRLAVASPTVEDGYGLPN